MRGMLVSAVVGSMLHVMTLGAGGQATLLIDPEIRGRVNIGRARVLVELQVGEATAEPRGEAIAQAQETLLSRLPPTHATLVRRYLSVPMLALEIDATALRALETMADLVVAVKLDHVVKPQ